MLSRYLVMVKGAGDLATGVIFRLRRAGFRVIATELAQPATIRRTVALSEAVFEGRVVVEGVEARRCSTPLEALHLAGQGIVPVLVDPGALSRSALQPAVLVDAIIAKRNTGTLITDAPIVIALGPGFAAGKDAHAVIETNRGHNLGRVLLEGTAEPNTGVPGDVGGESVRRIIRAPSDGILRPVAEIGQAVTKDEVVGWVEGSAVRSLLDGILRGMLRGGLQVTAGLKIGDVDPRAVREHCFTISDKALAVGGGVLEATLMLLFGSASPAV